MNVSNALLLTVVVSAWASAAAAQASSNGTIRGYVRDEQDAVLPGATITATSPAAPVAVTAVSDAEGYYRLLDLPPGEYAITAQLQGFSTFRRPGIVVRAGLNLGVDIDLVIGGQTETVTVAADSPLLETRTSARAVNISGDFQRSLPLTPRRNWSDFLELVPGVTTSQQNAEFYFVRGANLDEHVIRIDGASIDSGLQGGNTYIKFSTDALQDVQVKTAGGDAAAPLGLGAVIDVVTPSGTNDSRAVASLSYQGRSWNDSNAAGAVSAVRQVQAELSAGGPIQRDRAWFFAAYRYHDLERGISRTPEQLSLFTALVPGSATPDAENNGNYLFAKGTLQLARRHQAYAWYQYDKNEDNAVGGTETGAFLRRPRGGSAGAARLSSTWMSALTSQLVLSRTAKTFDSLVKRYDTPGRQVHAGSFLSSGRRTGTGEIALLDNRNTQENRNFYPKTTFGADVTYHRQGLVGSHEVQTGLFWQHIDGRLEQSFFNDGFIQEESVLRDPTNPSAGLLPFHRRIYDQPTAETFRGRSSNLAFYVQDVWRPASRVTLSVGARVELVRQNDDLFGVQTVTSTQLGPRLGVNYMVTGDGRNSVQASFARVLGNLTNTRFSVGSTAAAFRDLYDNDLDGTFETVFTQPASSQASSNQPLDPDYHQPYVDEWLLGYRRQLPGQTAVNAAFVRREYRDRPTSIEVNGIYDGGVFAGYRDERQNDILLRTNNSYNWPVYSSFEIEASRQTSRLQMLASYTRQWRHLAGTWQPNDPASFLQPGAFPNDKGIGATHVTESSLSTVPRTNWRDHVLKAALAYRAPWSLQLATNYSLQSGSWSGPIMTRLVAADPRFGPPTIRLTNGREVSNPLATVLRFASATRGERQFAGPTVHLWNVRVGREFAFGGRRISASLDLFNITNRGDFEILQNAAPQLFSPLYAQGASVQPPRAAQVLVRFSY